MADPPISGLVVNAVQFIVVELIDVSVNVGSLIVVGTVAARAPTVLAGEADAAGPFAFDAVIVTRMSVSTGKVNVPPASVRTLIGMSHERLAKIEALEPSQLIVSVNQDPPDA